jgi:hypothetical protein
MGNATASNGEQFRVTLARTLAEAPELAVVDEFTSVVDRTVAQIGSHALAKTIRASNRRFIAVSCHYDIEEWLQPDGKYDTDSPHCAALDLQFLHFLRLTRRAIRRTKSGLASDRGFLLLPLGNSFYGFLRILFAS